MCSFTSSLTFTFMMEGGTTVLKLFVGNLWWMIRCLHTHTGSEVILCAVFEQQQPK